MCRLFGFKSAVELSVHHSLRAAENAIAKQSLRHPDGWGIGYYYDGVPHLQRSSTAAFEDGTYERLARMLASDLVVAHVRKATVGEKNDLNTHPFQFGRWLFIHNGNVVAFDRIRDSLLEIIDEKLRHRILGETDSEHCFYLFLSFLLEGRERLPHQIDVREGIAALRATVHQIDTLSARFEREKRSELNFLVTNGEILLGTRRGIELYYSTKKHDCSIKSSCPHFSPHCLGPVLHDGKNTHVLIASEPISQEDIWEEIPDASVFAVDHEIQVRIEPIEASFTQPSLVTRDHSVTSSRR
ncbi:MAG: class II glutamine amidotransferase [Deltaproteobacteria bacterium]|nr:MAG: class II glutamine amidotransferase [Deltaproteobacteria bacterium]